MLLFSKQIMKKNKKLIDIPKIIDDNFIIQFFYKK